MFPSPRQEHSIFCLPAWPSGAFRSSYVIRSAYCQLLHVRRREKLWQIDML